MAPQRWTRRLAGWVARVAGTGRWVRRRRFVVRINDAAERGL